MNFLKKLFSSKKEAASTEGANFKGIYTTDHFDSRYKEEPVDPAMLDGCLKMVESYCHDNKIERVNKTQVNHPSNLDQVDREGFGFVLYCQAFGLGEEQATLFLAYAFSDYLIHKYGFRLYTDRQPEHPLRGMTLQYNKDSVVLSLYPYEYASKVLNDNQTFSALDEKVNAQLATLPAVNDVVRKYIDPDGDGA